MFTFSVIIFCFLSFLLGRNFKKIKRLFILYNKSKQKNKSENMKRREERICNDNDEIKMVFVVRQDLKMGAGKIAAQVAHAAIGLYDDIFEEENEQQKILLNDWFNSGQKKIVLKADNLNLMLEVVNQCKKLKLQYCMITDAGHTQIPAGSVTVLGIGPDIGERINQVTGNFKLMT